MIDGKSLPHRVRALACVSLMLVPTPSYAAQELDPAQVAERLRSRIAEAVVAGDEERLAGLTLVARRAVTAFHEDALLQHYLGYGLYRLATLRFAADPDEALATLRESELALLRSINLDPLPESHAVLSSVLGRQIVGDANAMSLSIRAGSEMERALALGPRNPRVRLLEGIRAFHTPPMYGGGFDLALDHFLDAAELFEKDAPAPSLPAWGRAEIHAWLGQTYAELDRTEEARAAYGRALEIEPSYAWVRETLLPALSP